MTLTSLIVGEVAKCAATKKQAKRLYISYSDLQKLMTEDNTGDWKKSGLFFGLSISLHSEGLPPIVIP